MRNGQQQQQQQDSAEWKSYLISDSTQPPTTPERAFFTFTLSLLSLGQKLGPGTSVLHWIGHMAMHYLFISIDTRIGSTLSFSRAKPNWRNNKLDRNTDDAVSLLMFIQTSKSSIFFKGNVKVIIIILMWQTFI